MKHLVASALLFFILLSACQPPPFYQVNKAFTDQVWTYNDPLESSFEISDTTQLYYIDLDVVHHRDFSFQNIYIKITTSFPDGKTVDDTLPLELKAKDSTWNGDCSGDWCDAHFKLIDRTAFRAIGMHKITIEQYGRQDSLRGVKSVQLLVNEIVVD